MEGAWRRARPMRRLSRATREPLSRCRWRWGSASGSPWPSASSPAGRIPLPRSRARLLNLPPHPHLRHRRRRRSPLPPRRLRRRRRALRPPLPRRLRPPGRSTRLPLRAGGPRPLRRPRPGRRRRPSRSSPSLSRLRPRRPLRRIPAIIRAARPNRTSPRTPGWRSPATTTMTMTAGTIRSGSRRESTGPAGGTGIATAAGTAEAAGTGRGGTGPKEAGAAAEATGEAWDEARRPRRGAPRRRLSLAPTTPAIPESTRVRDRGPGADRDSARSESRDDLATYGVVKSLSKASGAQKEAHANG